MIERVSLLRVVCDGCQTPLQYDDFRPYYATEEEAIEDVGNFDWEHWQDPATGKIYVWGKDCSPNCSSCGHDLKFDHDHGRSPCDFEPDEEEGTCDCPAFVWTPKEDM